MVIIFLISGFVDLALYSCLLSWQSTACKKKSIMPVRNVPRLMIDIPQVGASRDSFTEGSIHIRFFVASDDFTFLRCMSIEFFVHVY